jgi:hypothetical protein
VKPGPDFSEIHPMIAPAELVRMHGGRYATVLGISM